MKREVSRVKLSYTKNGVDWLPIIALKGNPGWYDWTLPQLKLVKPKTKCKVKVVLFDKKGNKINSDTSDFFTIKSPD
jgi:hypothetical protein